MRTVLLTARDPLEGADDPTPLRTARHLAAEGGDVVLVLLEEAVTLARDGHRDRDALAAALAAGVTVLADEEALRRRAVVRVGDGVKPTDLGAVVDLLMDGSDRQAWL